MSENVVPDFVATYEAQS